MKLAEFAHNYKPHSARGMSPFEIIMGYQPRAFPSVSFTSNVSAVEERLKRITHIRSETTAAHALAQRRMEMRFPNKFEPYKLHQQVWLDTKNIKMPYENRKLSPKREGPFCIKEVLGRLTYKLDIPDTWKIHPVFHATLLVPYRETDEHGTNKLRPPPETIDEQEEYEVEAILKHRKNR